MFRSIIFLLSVILVMTLPADNTIARSFQDEQEKFPRVREARANQEKVLDSMLAGAGLSHPPFRILIRAFKFEKELEVWAVDSGADRFVHLKTYPFTASSGKPGPKRYQGDRQIPEGFYYIDRFNPKSKFHLSLGLNYPNKSDRIRKTRDNAGGDIFIHGNQVTIGCIPVGDEAIEELYLLAVDAKSGGQKKIPVHIFPYRLDDDNKKDRIGFSMDISPELEVFWDELKTGYLIFQDNRILPGYTITDSGKYKFSNGQGGN